MIARFLSSKFSGYVALIGLAVITALVWYIYNEGKQSCVVQATNAKIEIIEKRNAITNKRPDFTNTVKRLREGTF